MSHGDQVHDDRRGLHPGRRDVHLPVAAVRHRTLPDLRPPVPPRGRPHALRALLILGNFLDGSAGAPGSWTMDAFLDRAVDQIGAGSGRGSGRLRALRRGRLGRLRGPAGQGPGPPGGLRLRRQRPAPVGRARRPSPRRSAGTRAAELRVVDAADRFLGRPPGVIDPQEKRIRIGHTFIDVFRDEAKSIDGATFLAQGTLYPDVIESGVGVDGPAATIKHHHNVGGLPAELGFKLIEPLARPLQGRGPPPRPGAGPARVPGLAPPVPRPRPGRPLPGRGHRRSGSTSSARPTRSSSRSWPRPACTARSARRSPSSCPSSRSA